MSERLIDEMPEVELHTVGDCEMLPNMNGEWVTKSSIKTLLEWVVDNDDRDVMMERIAQIREVL